MLISRGFRVLRESKLGFCDEKKHVEIPEREHHLDEYTIDQLNKYQSGWEIIE